MRESSKKAIYLFLSLFVFIVLLTTTVQAQDDPGCPTGNCNDDPDVPVPIDGGASLLIAAGVAYGLKKINDKRKENHNPDIHA